MQEVSIYYERQMSPYYPEDSRGRQMLNLSVGWLSSTLHWLQSLLYTPIKVE